MDMNKLLENYGCLTFSDDIMRERIPKSTYKAFHEALDKGEPLANSNSYCECYENMGSRKWGHSLYTLVYANDGINC